MKKPSELLYIGVDIHRKSHAACVTDCFGQILWQSKISNDLDGFISLDRKVKSLAAKQNLIPILGLEDCYGNGLFLAHYLAQKGYDVKVVNPVLVDHLRKKTTHPEKSDPLDARGVAEVLIRQGRTDKLPSFSISHSQQLAKSIKELNNDRKTLVKEQTRLKNQMHQLIYYSYGANYRELFKNIFSKKALKFFMINPLSDQADKNNLPIAGDILASQIRRKTGRLLDIAGEIKEIEGELRELIDKSGQQLESLRGCGLVTAATVLAEVKDIKRFHSINGFAKYAGVCPRKKSSGSSEKDKKTRAGNRTLNCALHGIALSQIGKYGSEWGKAYYEKKLAEGKNKKAALTCLKRRLVDIIYMMLKNQQPYEFKANS